MDIRLKTTPFEFDGKYFELCCNMNVLADVQEAFGGDMDAALSVGTSARSVMEFLAAMLNDYADSKGWPDRYTARELGRMFPAGESKNLFSMIMDLVIRALADPDPTDSEQETDEKNGDTRRNGVESISPGT